MSVIPMGLNKIPTDIKLTIYKIKRIHFVDQSGALLIKNVFTTTFKGAVSLLYL